MQLHQGEIYWVKLDKNDDTEIVHPHVIVLDDILGNSRIDYTIVCGISTNMKKAYGIGNVLLEEGEANLKRRSIVVVSQISLVKKDQIGEYIGTLTSSKVEEILHGITQQQNLS